MSAQTMAKCLIPSNFEQITVTNSSALLSTLLSGGIPANVDHAIFYPEGNVRWRADGTDPTVTVGIVMNQNEIAVFEGQPLILKAMKLIATVSTKVNVHLFR